MRGDLEGAGGAGEVGAGFGEDGADGGLDVLFGREGHEFGAGVGGTVGEGLFVADWYHAVLYGVGVGEFACLAGEELRVAFPYLEIPVCQKATISWGNLGV